MSTARRVKMGLRFGRHSKIIRGILGRTIRTALCALAALSAALCGALPARALDPALQIYQYRLETWTTKDGLPPRKIYNIVQTANGYVWMSSEQGVVRFDGMRFKTFDSGNTPGLTSDYILSVAPDINDPDGLWVGTSGAGLSYLKEGRATHIALPDVDGRPLEHIFTLLSTPDLGLVFGDWRLCTWKNNKLTSLGPLQSTSAKIQRAANGDLWVAASGGMTVRSQSGKTRQISTARESNVCLAPDGSFWSAVFGEGVRHWKKDGTTTLYTPARGLPSTNVNTVFCDHAGNVWVGTDQGLSRLQNGRFQNFGRADGLGDDKVSCMMEDQEDNLWVVAGATLNRLNNPKLIPLAFADFEPRIVRHDLDNNLWYATDKPELVAHINGRYARYGAASGLPDAVPNAMCTARSGGVWVTYDTPKEHVLLRFYQGRVAQRFAFAPVTTRAIFAAGGESLACIIETKDGVLLYRRIDKKPGQLFWQQDGKTRRAALIPLEEMGGRTWQARDGSLYVSSWNKQIHARNGKLHTVPLPKNLIVYDTFLDRDDTLWLAGQTGLGRYKNGAFALYNRRQGLPDNKVSQVGEDKAGNLWVACNRGIFQARKSDFDRLDAGKIRQLPHRFYDAADGLRFFPHGQSLPTNDGKIWFKGLNGVTMIDPARLRNNPLPPPVRIESVRINGVAVRRRAGKAQIAPGRGNVQIEFTGLSFVAPEKVRFRYRLAGFDKGWQDADSRRSATYTNLPPGNYRFEVSAANNDGVWNPKPVALEFVLQPFFYQNSWFRFCVATILLLVLLLLFRLRVRGLEKQRARLEAAVRDRTSELEVANNELAATQLDLQSVNVELEAQNEELQSMQAEMEAHNEDLQRAHEETAQRNTELRDANARLEGLATTDGLTGLKNHRAFQEYLHQEWTHTARYGDPLSLILLDVDAFKTYNDTFGHPAGDEVLQRVAEVLLGEVRAADFVARYGGEEYAVVLPRTGSLEAMEIAERLRQALINRDWPLRAITASFGCATATLAMANQTMLIAQADAALYGSKQAGRNRVMHAGELTVGIADAQ